MYVSPGNIDKYPVSGEWRYSTTHVQALEIKIQFTEIDINVLGIKYHVKGMLGMLEFFGEKIL